MIHKIISFYLLFLILFGHTLTAMAGDDFFDWGPLESLEVEGDMPSSTSTLIDDGRPWRFDAAQDRKIIVIGDVHGDIKALISLMHHLGLVDESGKWKNKEVDLVFLGDLTSKGPDSRKVLEYIWSLEKIVGEDHLHVLIGNHELMLAQGVFKYLSKEDIKNLDTHAIKEGHIVKNRFDSAKQFFTDPKGKFATWIKKKNSIIKIGDKLFTHGGLESWEQPIGVINSSIRKWIDYYINGNGDPFSMPPYEEIWTIEHGPHWTRSMSLEKMPESEFHSILEKYSATEIFVGHTTVDQIQNKYNGKLWLVDTGMSEAYPDNSNISAITIQGNEISTTSLKKTSAFKCVDVLIL